MATLRHRLFVAATITTAACSNLDGEVVPNVERATLVVDLKAPDELAMIDISLELSAGPSADHTVELWDVWLLQPTKDRSDHRLKLALPGGSLDLGPDDEVVVDLVNVGTTNADLIPLCEQLVDVLLNIRYLDDPMMSGFADVDPQRVAVDCN